MMEIINGDCLEEMQKMEANSIAAIVTDPPYGLHFDGASWDKFNFGNCGDHKKHETELQACMPENMTAKEIANFKNLFINSEFKRCASQNRALLC